MAGAIDKEKSEMKFIVCAATLVFLLWGTPALAGPCTDDDADGVCDAADNCTPPNAQGSANPAQDDTDGDDCGNICDADYDQSGGSVDFTDLFDFLDFFGLTDALHDHTEPVGGGPIDFTDLFLMLDMFGLPPGPSGTTVGTAVCP